MNELAEPVLPYNGTEGYVSGSDTSRERALKEAQSGKVTFRQTTVLDALHSFPDGLTWKELSLMLGLHHGQISATLSVLHGAGKIVALKSKKEGSHPYLSLKWIEHHHPSQVIWQPAKTLAGKKKKALDNVLAAARAADLDYNLETCSWLKAAISEFDAISDT